MARDPQPRTHALDRAVTGGVLPLVAAGFGIGIALAGAPGPVQAVLVAEAVNGGVPRGLRALVGASATFGGLVLALALGASVAPPSGSLLHGLEAVGGAFLLWMAWDGLRTGARVPGEPDRRRSLPPVARGAMAIVLNPGAWLFLGAVAAPLVAAGAANGGVAPALFVAAALVSGAAAGDAAIVVLGGLGARRAGRGASGRWLVWIPAGVLALLGAWLLVHGLMSLVSIHT